MLSIRERERESSHNLLQLDDLDDDLPYDARVHLLVVVVAGLVLERQLLLVGRLLLLAVKVVIRIDRCRHLAVCKLQGGRAVAILIAVVRSIFRGEEGNRN